MERWRGENGEIGVNYYLTFSRPQSDSCVVPSCSTAAELRVPVLLCSFCPALFLSYPAGSGFVEADPGALCGVTGWPSSGIPSGAWKEDKGEEMAMEVDVG